MQLKINKVNYRLVWGLPAIDQYCTNVGHSDDIESAFNLAFPPAGSKTPILKTVKARAELIYAALQIGARIDRVEFDLTITDLQAWIDQSDQEVVDDVFNDFFKSKYMGKSIEEYLFVSDEQEEAPKKKSRAAKS